MLEIEKKKARAQAVHLLRDSHVNLQQWSRLKKVIGKLGPKGFLPAENARKCYQMLENAKKELEKC